MLLPVTIQRPREGTKLLAVFHHVDRARCSLLMTLAVTRSQNLRVQAASSTGANTEGSGNAKALCSVQVVQQRTTREVHKQVLHKILLANYAQLQCFKCHFGTYCVKSISQSSCLVSSNPGDMQEAR